MGRVREARERRSLMPTTTDIRDCEKLATAIVACGGVVPDPLGYLLSAHRLLSRPQAVQRPETAILTAALDGDLDQRTLDRLLPAAATAAMVNGYRVELARDSEHVLLGAFHRELAAGGPTTLLDSLRANFDSHAGRSRRLGGCSTPQSTPDEVLASGQPELVTAWQQLNGHLAVVAKICAVASQFGCRPQAQFPRVKEFALGDTFKIDDRALMCTTGPLGGRLRRFQSTRPGALDQSVFFAPA